MGGKMKTRTTKWKPAAVTKKMDDTTLKMKDPPTQRVDEEGQTDGKKPAAKENVQDKKKRRNAKLPLHPNFMACCQN
jgi:hypothetical protein